MSQTIPLSFPIEIGGRTISDVTIRRPKVGDLRRMEKHKGSDFDRTMRVLADLTELAPEELDELDTSDLQALSKVLEGFMGSTGD